MLLVIVLLVLFTAMMSILHLADSPAPEEGQRSWPGEDTTISPSSKEEEASPGTRRGTERC